MESGMVWKQEEREVDVKALGKAEGPRSVVPVVPSLCVVVVEEGLAIVEIEEGCQKVVELWVLVWQIWVVRVLP